jgi:hypothetical protein
MTAENIRPRRNNDRVIEANFEDHALKVAVDAHAAILAETNKHLKELAECAKDTQGFFSKLTRVYVPWAVAVIGVLYPTVGKIIAGLPAFNP